VPVGNPVKQGTTAISARASMTVPLPLLRLPFVNRLAGRPPVVAVLPLYGPIGSVAPFRFGLSLASLNERIEAAFRLPGLAAVALLVNSPGGSAVQSSLIAGRIRALAEEREVKVYAFCEDFAASGGYWLACAADEIYVDESSLVGSIGVVAGSFGFPELLRRFGIERRMYVAGEKKNLFDPFREESPEAGGKITEFIGSVHDSFAQMVRRRRDGRLKADEATLFSGEFWDGRRAVELGLADGIGEMNATLRGVYGEKVILRRIRGRRSLFPRRPFVGEDLWLPQG
jgi:signal peptide peptidase SppA